MSGWWNSITKEPRPPLPTMGLNSSMLRPEDLTHLARLGMRHVRVPGILQKWEKDEGNYRAVILDMNRAAEENGIKLLWYLHNVVDDTPASIYDLWSGKQWVVRMTNFCIHIASLSATEAIQPWNEPNGYRQQPFGVGNNLEQDEIGGHYSAAFRSHHAAIRQTNPLVIVVTAGLTLLPRWQDCLRIITTHTKADAYAIHPYGPWDKARPAIEEAKSLGAAPLWATEFGNDQQNGEVFSERYHLDCWRTFIEGNDNKRLAPRMYGYALQTDGRPEYSQHGLFKPGTDEPRQTYWWLTTYKPA